MVIKKVPKVPKYAKSAMKTKDLQYQQKLDG